MILEKIGEAAMYEQLAEEATELAKAALTMARILRGENPLPVTKNEALGALEEETTDVQFCLDELGLESVDYIKHKKLVQFQKRWEERWS